MLTTHTEEEFKELARTLAETKKALANTERMLKQTKRSLKESIRKGQRLQSIIDGHRADAHHHVQIKKHARSMASKFLGIIKLHREEIVARFPKFKEVLDEFVEVFSKSRESVHDYQQLLTRICKIVGVSPVNAEDLAARLISIRGTLIEVLPLIACTEGCVNNSCLRCEISGEILELLPKDLHSSQYMSVFVNGVYFTPSTSKSP